MKCLNILKDCSGFTLVELIITLVIASILIAVAVPGYYMVVENNRIADMTNRLTSSFNLARVEAIKRGARVSVCPAANQSFNSCGSATQWAQGWIIFVDADENNSIDNNSNILQISEALPENSSVVSTGSIVSYDSNGFLASAAITMNLTATYCTGKNARQLNIATSGRLNLSTTACS